MTKDWQELMKLTRDRKFTIERVKLAESDIAIEGSFKLPELARLSADDQVFVAAFVRCHGSIKQMEKYFGVSYPTIKNRLNRIGQSLEFVKIEAEPAKTEVLAQLERGEISVNEAIDKLKEGDNDV
jgi:hypothetical protein